MHLEVGGGGTLKVDATDGTEFGRDVEFSGMYLDNGSTIKPASLDPLVFEDLVAGSWRFEVGVLTDGPHHLRFSLGGNTAYASNTASITDVTSDTADGNYSTGDTIDIRMNFTEKFALNQFAIRDNDHDATRMALTELDGPEDITTVTIGSSTYALVASHDSNSVQIIDITDPSSPTVASNVTDDQGGFTTLKGARGITTATIDSSTYALVAAYKNRGVQIIDITDPLNPTATAAVKDNRDGFTELKGAIDITTATIGSSTYALVAAYDDDGVQIINITNASSPTFMSAAVTDGEGGFTELDGAQSITTATIGSSTYALVASYVDEGVQIIDITDPSNPTATAAVTDDQNGFTRLDGPRGITTATIDGSHYALVTSQLDGGGVQIINITDPSNPTATAAVKNDPDGFTALDWARDITTATIDSSTYALVTSERGNNAVQIINITDPENPTAAAAVTEGQDGFTDLDKPWGITTAIINGTPYALITLFEDDGVQIIDITDPSSPTATAAVAKGQGGFTELEGPIDITTATIGGFHYALGLLVLRRRRPDNRHHKRLKPDGNGRRNRRPERLYPSLRALGHHHCHHRPLHVRPGRLAHRRRRPDNQHHKRLKPDGNSRRNRRSGRLYRA